MLHCQGREVKASLKRNSVSSNIIVFQVSKMNRRQSSPGKHFAGGGFEPLILYHTIHFIALITD